MFVPLCYMGSRKNFHKPNYLKGRHVQSSQYWDSMFNGPHRTHLVKMCLQLFIMVCAAGLLAYRITKVIAVTFVLPATNLLLHPLLTSCFNLLLETKAVTCLVCLCSRLTSVQL